MKNQQVMNNDSMIQPANLKTNRSLIKFLLLSMVTFGIYGLIAMCEMVNALNLIATKYDGKNTSNYVLALILTPFTFGIYGLIWFHLYSNRIGDELKRRGIGLSFSSKTLWGWGIIGAIIYIGPIVYIYKLIQAINILCVDFNQRG